ncbi:family 20 glycosylhydrolase [Jonesiaceae bacterium BS-20]|uniref:beta-N-acetylhexosaminidase n=1 Tax=Jonesiaceae bacterium BS-20 TaxID=3120821 RepID=A0AAU7DV18_9MICO
MLPHIIPAPQKLHAISPQPLVVFTTTLHELAGQLSLWAPGAAARLTEAVGSLPALTTSPGQDLSGAAASQTAHAVLDASLPPESFSLVASAAQITLTASNTNGALYAVNALIQALRTEGVVEFSATSAPQYGWRGTMLDISRHFFGVPEIKAVIDLASQYNLNQLHLHLSDDQGWRIEIEGRPELVKLAADNDVDGGKGGHLSLVDYAEIQDYAELYGMTLVPEIDLPGHTNALQVAYPELTPDGIPRKPYAGIEVGFSYVHLTSPKTWAVLEDIVASLAKHTRGEYLHMGGDEVLKVDRPDFEAFMGRLGKLVNKHGKKLTLWHEGAGADLPPGTQLQYWTHDSNQENLSKAFDIPAVSFIASPAKHAYLDLKPVKDFPLGLTWAGLVNLETAFDWDPVQAIPVPGHLISGVEACLWTETIRSIDDITTMLLPRLPAVASVAWGSTGSFERFTDAIANHARLWQDQEIVFYRDPAVTWH